MGRGTSKGAAKRDAAKQVYKILSVNDHVPGAGDGDDLVGYALKLSLFLKRHETGNLTPFLHFVMSKGIRDDAPVHIATVKCEHPMALHQSARPLN